ncbi:MAG TPA: hypothetical protein VH482_15185 [Thermomicrobiales bacterium]|jgi:hypothetical protein
MRVFPRRSAAERRPAPAEDAAPLLAEVRRLRAIARRLADLAERVLDGQPVSGTPWADLLCEQDGQCCDR